MRAGLLQYFKPEFINRLDDIVRFHALTREQISEIVDLQVARVIARVAERGVQVTLTDAARELIANMGYDPTYGARPLRRVIQKQLTDRLALALLKGELREGDSVRVDAVDGRAHVERDLPTVAGPDESGERELAGQRSGDGLTLWLAESVEESTNLQGVVERLQKGAVEGVGERLAEELLEPLCHMPPEPDLGTTSGVRPGRESSGAAPAVQSRRMLSGVRHRGLGDVGHVARSSSSTRRTVASGSASSIVEPRGEGTRQAGRLVEFEQEGAIFIRTHSEASSTRS